MNCLWSSGKKIPIYALYVLHCSIYKIYLLLCKEIYNLTKIFPSDACERSKDAKSVIYVKLYSFSYWRIHLKARIFFFVSLMVHNLSQVPGKLQKRKNSYGHIQIWSLLTRTSRGSPRKPYISPKSNNRSHLYKTYWSIQYERTVDLKCNGSSAFFGNLK